jgi:hypothetical protein
MAARPLIKLLPGPALLIVIALAGGLVAAALLAVFGLPYGGSHRAAFAHVYTFPGNGNTAHLHIDADITNGTRPCDPIDTETSVVVGSAHKVGVCIENYDTSGEPKTGTCTKTDHSGCGTGSIESFELHIRYSGDPDATPPTTINVATEIADPGYPDPLVDNNPDGNDGDDATGFKLGGGWKCDCLGIPEGFPKGDDPRTPGVADALIICYLNVTAPDKDLDADPGLLATVEFTATKAGTDTIDFGPIDESNKNSVGKPLPAGGVADCGTTVAEGQVGCFGATIHKVAAPTATPTPTPTPDSDGDGISDAQDACPNDPEDFDGFQDEDGCPDGDFSFAIITDLHVGRYTEYGDDEYYLTKRLEDTVDWINRNAQDRNIKFVVVLGDLSEKAVEGELDKAKTILRGLTVPYIPVIGNHDTGTDEHCPPLEERGKAFRDQFRQQFQELRTFFGGEARWAKSDDSNPPYLQNFAFDYRGVRFIGLDFVTRDCGALPTVFPATTTWLRERIQEHAQADRPTPIIILAHHPLLGVTEHLPVCAGCFFWADDIPNIRSAIQSGRGASTAEIKSFGGHVHGYRGNLWGVWNANYEKTDGAYVGIPVVITEALMVGSNEVVGTEQEDKGFVRIVNVNDTDLDIGGAEGISRAALNPDFDCDWQPHWSCGDLWFGLYRCVVSAIDASCQAHAYTDRNFSCDWDFNNDGKPDDDKCETSYSYPSEGTKIVKLTVRPAGSQGETTETIGKEISPPQDIISPGVLLARVDVGETLRYAVNVDAGPDAVVDARWTGSTVKVSLISPSGRRLECQGTYADVSCEEGASFVTYHVQNAELGEWTVELFGADVPPGGEEVLIVVATSRFDNDLDGVADGPDDPDGSGPIAAGPDNCALVYNPGQENADNQIGNGTGIAGHDGTVPNSAGDLEGDACETDGDIDNDGIANASDTDPGGDITYDDNNDGFMCPKDTADDGPSWDSNCNGKRDGVQASCPLATNPRGDDDGDGLLNTWEVCKWGTNPAVLDSDADTLGDCKEAADVDGNSVVNFTGDVIAYAQAIFLAPAAFGQDGDFDIDGNNNLDFTGDVMQEAQFALIDGLCK